MKILMFIYVQVFASEKILDFFSFNIINNRIEFEPHRENDDIGKCFMIVSVCSTRFLFFKNHLKNCKNMPYTLY